MLRACPNTFEPSCSILTVSGLGDTNKPTDSVSPTRSDQSVGNKQVLGTGYSLVGFLLVLLSFLS